MEGAGRVRISVAPPSSSQPRDDVSDRLRRLAGSSVPANSKSIANDEWKRDEQLTREEKRALSKANKLNIYNVGVKDNWKAVMGSDWRYWALPVGEPESDGYSFQINTATLQRLEEVTANVRGGGGKTKSSMTFSSSLQEGSSDSGPIVTQSSSSPPLNSIRGKARSQPSPFSPPQSKAKYRSSAHGLVEWGAPPKKDFVLYGLNDDDVDSGGVLAADPKENSSFAIETPRDAQMDADVWS